LNVETKMIEPQDRKHAIYVKFVKINSNILYLPTIMNNITDLSLWKIDLVYSINFWFAD
jgi:hypothetical protein